MKLSALVWGLIWLGAGLIVALGLLPGSDGWAVGPRVGISVLLIMLGLTVAVAGNMAWILRKTTKPEDYVGGCPVGAKCPACETFNMKPRTTCKECGKPIDLT